MQRSVTIFFAINCKTITKLKTTFDGNETEQSARNEDKTKTNF